MKFAKLFCYAAGFCFAFNHSLTLQDPYWMSSGIVISVFGVPLVVNALFKLGAYVWSRTVTKNYLS